jgi:ankyrin repeat protein
MSKPSKPFNFEEYKKYLDGEEMLKLRKAEVLKMALEGELGYGIEILYKRCYGKEVRLMKVIKTHKYFKDDEEIKQKLFEILTKSKSPNVFKWGADILLRLDSQNINLCNEEGETLLHLAAIFRDPDLIIRLVREMNFEQVMAQNSRGESFLQCLLSGVETPISLQEYQKQEEAYLAEKRLTRFSDFDAEFLKRKRDLRLTCLNAAIYEILVRYGIFAQRESEMVMQLFDAKLEKKDWQPEIEKRILLLYPQFANKENEPFFKRLFLVTNFLSNEFKTKFARQFLSINIRGNRVSLEHLKALLNCQFDFNFPFIDSVKSETLLMRCARYNETDAVVLLCQSRKVDLDALDFDGRSSLHLALEGGHIDIANILIDAGINLEYIKVKPGVGAPSLFKILQKKLSESPSPQEREVYEGLYKRIEKKIIDNNISSFNGYKIAISRNVKEIFSQFMEDKYDVLKKVIKNFGTYESEFKTDKEFEVTMRTLFALGLPKQIEVPTRLGTKDSLSTYAFRVGNYSFAAFLADNGAGSEEPNPNQEIVLFTAVKDVIRLGKAEKGAALNSLENILKCKINPNTTSLHSDIFRGATPLLIAAQNQDLELAKLLLTYGADMDMTVAIREESGLIKTTCVENCCKEQGKDYFFKTLKQIALKSSRSDTHASPGTRIELRPIKGVVGDNDNVSISSATALVSSQMETFGRG